MYSHILIATDGSGTATKAVSRGVRLAGSLGAKVTLLAVGPPDKAQAVVDDAAAEVSRIAAPGVEIATMVESGDPAGAIIDTAERIDADLIVVGNKGMQGARRLLLSNVPNKVVHYATRAVLVVRTT